MKKYAVLTREPRCFLGSFDFSWEQRKLGDIADIVGGGTPSTGNQSYWDGDIDWYAPAEIGEQSYVSKSKKTKMNTCFIISVPTIFEICVSFSTSIFFLSLYSKCFVN